MTSAAQDALRRAIEMHSKVTRFCLICNYVSKIIEPLASRCVKFRFKPLETKLQVQRLEHIASNEGIQCEADVLEELVLLANGDLRKSVTYLQSSVNLYGQEFNKDQLTQIAGVIPKQRITEFFAACQQGSFDALKTIVIDLVADGYSAALILDQMHSELLNATELSDVQKAHIGMAFAAADGALVDGADELLQLLSVAAACAKVSK
eukprot:TRINITY_DN1256_c0_g1_i2.p2 TRINITY_DN1256_c0_g1~~TRINITY_DN1256_c0_g1_i2.p2  ORF type:complete len:207 (+),score=55.45 TRINITY_DN1256_c0_g1_i2:586-1206(+)